MAVRIEVQRAPIFSEFSPVEQEKFFGITRDKVIHNVDTLYYSVGLVETPEFNAFVAELKSLRENYTYDADEPVEVEGLTYRPANFSIYRHCFSEKDSYDIFIAEKVPNKNTPQVVVQIRSIHLWAYGDKKAVELSFEAVLALLHKYGLIVRFVAENRIDYAFHTNCIQNTSKFFGDRVLTQNMNGTLTQYSKVGKVGREVTVDYLSLGKRQSNNVFFRAYNKTREVIEMGYKSIFIDIWQKNKLISEYDAYVLRYAFEANAGKNGFESAIARGKIAWYMENGTDSKVKNTLEELREKYLVKNSNVVALDKQLSKILPEITQICNIEFQTKRHFYRSFGKTIGASGNTWLARIFWILDNRKKFLDILTCDTVRFVKDRDMPKNDITEKDYLFFWRRVRAVKTPCEVDTTLARQYLKNVDVERAKSAFAGKVATFAVLNGNYEDVFALSVADALSYFNDNDVNTILDRLVDNESGELAALTYKDYDLMVGRKKRQYAWLINAWEKDNPPEQS